jgi:hypothetical protein
MRPRRTDDCPGPEAAAQISQGRPPLTTSHLRGAGSGRIRQRDGKAVCSNSSWKDAGRVVRTWYSTCTLKNREAGILLRHALMVAGLLATTIPANADESPDDELSGYVVSNKLSGP